MTFTLFVLDVLQLIPSSLLLVYGLFKPDDNIERFDDEEVPQFIQDTFKYIEGSRLARLIKQKDKEILPLNLELQNVVTKAPDEGTY